MKSVFSKKWQTAATFAGTVFSKKLCMFWLCCCVVYGVKLRYILCVYFIFSCTRHCVLVDCCGGRGSFHFCACLLHHVLWCYYLSSGFAAFAHKGGMHVHAVAPGEFFRPFFQAPSLVKVHCGLQVRTRGTLFYPSGGFSTGHSLKIEELKLWAQAQVPPPILKVPSLISSILDSRRHIFWAFRGGFLFQSAFIWHVSLQIPSFGGLGFWVLRDVREWTLIRAWI